MEKQLTKIDYAQLLLKRLYPNTTADKKTTEPQAMLAISQAANKLRLREIFQLKSTGSNLIPSQYLSVFTEETKYDEDRCEVYCDLPVRVLSINSKQGTNQGLYFVSFAKNRSQQFIPTGANFSSAFRYSAAKSLEGEIAFYQEENRLYFVDGVEKGEKVFMRLLADAEDIGEYDYFPIDGAVQQDMLAMAQEILMPQRQMPEDLRTDNISE